MSLELLTPDVIRSHVVPGEVLFTRPANYSDTRKGKNEPYHFRYVGIGNLQNIGKSINTVSNHYLGQRLSVKAIPGWRWT